MTYTKMNRRLWGKATCSKQFWDKTYLNQRRNNAKVLSILFSRSIKSWIIKFKYFSGSRYRHLQGLKIILNVTIIYATRQ